ncbi:MAG: hypothetical protein AAF514_17535, partial [Verrucomicrobiota bacterium]
DLDLLAGLPPEESGKNRPGQLKKELEHLNKIVPEFKTGHPLVTALENRIGGLRSRIPGAEKEFQKRRAAKEKRELAKLTELRKELEPLGPGLKFGQAKNRLRDWKPETPVAREVLEDVKFSWDQAGTYLDLLIADLNTHGFEGRLERKGERLLMARLSQATRNKLHVVEVGKKEKREIALSALSPAGLCHLGETVLSQLNDSNAYYQRWEALTHFALQTGLHDYAQWQASRLQRELPLFRARWQRLFPPLNASSL